MKTMNQKLLIVLPMGFYVSKNISCPGPFLFPAETHAINVIHESNFKNAPTTGIKGLKIGSEFLVASTEKNEYYSGEEQSMASKNLIDIFFNSK